MDLITLSLIPLKFLLQVQQTSTQVDSTSMGYKIGVYIGGFLPFIGLLIVFLIIIRSSYRFKKNKK